MRVEWTFPSKDEPGAREEVDRALFDLIAQSVCPVHQRHLDHLEITATPSGRTAVASLCCANLVAEVGRNVGARGTVVPFSRQGAVASKKRAG
jgi:hypothetical protein